MKVVKVRWPALHLGELKFAADDEIGAVLQINFDSTVDLFMSTVKAGEMGPAIRFLGSVIKLLTSGDEPWCTWRADMMDQVSAEIDSMDAERH